MLFSFHPVVYLETNGEITKNCYVDGDLYIQGNGEYESQYNGKIQLKGRGNKSFDTDKKPYKLKLEKKTNLFGFGKTKHYVLLNNYYDSSLIRNATAFELSKELGLITTDYIWVDVVFNGEYSGNYLLCEYIKIGNQLIDIYDYEDLCSTFAKKVCKDYKSLDKDELENLLIEDFSWMQNESYILPNSESVLVSDYVEIPKEYNGGYIWELTDSTEEYTYKTKHGIKVEVKSPEQITTNSDMLSDSLEILQDFEDAIYSSNGYNEKGQHYTELVDIDSMVNYFLVNEILGNEDSASRSRYVYQDKNGKIVFGPVWDFDIGGASYLSYKSAKGWCSTCSLVSWFTKQDLFCEIVNDPYFQTLLRDKYLTIRPYLEYIIEDGGLVDSLINEVYESGVVNSNKWYGFFEKNKRTFSGKNGDAVIYKKYLIERIGWIDEVCKTNASVSKSFSGIFSSNKYKTSKNVEIIVKNGTLDENNSKNAYIVDQNDIEITVNSLKGFENNIYINGLFFKKIDNGESIVVPQNLLTKTNGDNNVISVISVSGEKEYKNHITIRYDIERQLKEYSSIECAHENTIHIDNFVGLDGHYDIKECDYCLNCNRYLQNGKAVNDSEVIINRNNYHFSINKYQYLAIWIGVIMVVLTVGIVATKKLIKRKKKGK